MPAPVFAPTLPRPSIWVSVALALMATAMIPAAAVMGRSLAPPGPKFTMAETGQTFETLQQAVDAIGAGRGTIEIERGTYRECAVQKAGVVTYVARYSGLTTFDGVACEGKAALVLRGVGAEVRGLTFSGINVRDGNGAGIRLEKGALNVAYSRFHDSQQGILTANDPSGRIYIARSTFSGLGTCENSAGCAHSIYVGDYGELTVRESRFERGRGGHYLKARARQVVIESNSFDDANGFETNYMIDLPAGATGRIADNWFVQGRDKQNYSAFIALGAEKQLHSSDGLTVTNNEARFVPGLRRSSAFLADWTRASIRMSGNRLADGLEQYERR